jgi:MFS family permease
MAAPVAAIVLAAVGMGIGLEIFVINWDTTLQQHVPQEALSRVNSYDALGSLVFLPLGQVVLGPLAEQLGLRMTLYLAAGVVLTAVGALLATRDVRQLQRLA